MKVLFIEWKSFGKEDILEAFRILGHTVIRLPFHNVDYRSDKAFEDSLASRLRTESPEYVFSFNYFPIVSKVCCKEDIPYVSWIYDSPYVLLYSYTTINPCNHIYVFDKQLCLEFNRAGILTVNYLPMAAYTGRLDSMASDSMPAALKSILPKSDIAFVGAMYTEKHQFYQRLQGISDYTRGYLEGIMAAQQKVYGYNFIQEVLPPEIIADIKKILPMEPNSDGVESTEYLYAQYVINRRISGLERLHLISLISRHYPIDVYTSDKTLNADNIIRHDPIDYFDMTPYVIKASKINLNISLRSIKSGIPLRAFDILGSGGFLLTNYQDDFLDFFQPGEDFDYYESEQDLINKITYYLHHDDERIAIAASGHDKVAAGHTYLHRIREWESYL